MLEEARDAALGLLFSQVVPELAGLVLVTVGTDLVVARSCAAQAAEQMDCTVRARRRCRVPGRCSMRPGAPSTLDLPTSWPAGQRCTERGGAPLGLRGWLSP